METQHLIKLDELIQAQRSNEISADKIDESTWIEIREFEREIMEIHSG